MVDMVTGDFSLNVAKIHPNPEKSLWIIFISHQDIIFDQKWDLRNLKNNSWWYIDLFNLYVAYFYYILIVKL